MTSRTVAHQASLSMRFPKQECWSGLPFPSPGDLPVLGIEPRCPALHLNRLSQLDYCYLQCQISEQQCSLSRPEEDKRWTKDQRASLVV